jgi:hypothetical protein
MDNWLERFAHLLEKYGQVTNEFWEDNGDHRIEIYYYISDGQNSQSFAVTYANYISPECVLEVKDIVTEEIWQRKCMPR